MNQLCVAVWLTEEESYEWCIGYVQEVIEDNYQVDNLT